mmetsp:Transcript_56383/g.167803  ORF Transcript_56383/g.167803 Transcript_56383/m.167803 type:complete len:439 (-) Transcript_56383:220-1536(-)
MVLVKEYVGAVQRKGLRACNETKTLLGVVGLDDAREELAGVTVHVRVLHTPDRLEVPGPGLARSAGLDVERDDIAHVLVVEPLTGVEEDVAAQSLPNLVARYEAVALGIIERPDHADIGLCKIEVRRRARNRKRLVAGGEELPCKGFLLLLRLHLLSHRLLLRLHLRSHCLQGVRLLLQHSGLHLLQGLVLLLQVRKHLLLQDLLLLLLQLLQVLQLQLLLSHDLPLHRRLAFCHPALGILLQGLAHLGLQLCYLRLPQQLRIPLRLPALRLANERVDHALLQNIQLLLLLPRLQQVLLRGSRLHWHRRLRRVPRPRYHRALRRQRQVAAPWCAVDLVRHKFEAHDVTNAEACQLIPVQKGVKAKALACLCTCYEAEAAPRAEGLDEAQAVGSITWPPLPPLRLAPRGPRRRRVFGPLHKHVLGLRLALHHLHGEGDS